MKIPDLVSLDAELCDMVSATDSLKSNPNSDSLTLSWADAAGHVGLLVRVLVAQRHLELDPDFEFPDELDGAEFDDDFAIHLDQVRESAQAALFSPMPSAAVRCASWTVAAAEIGLDLLNGDRS